VYKFKVDDIFAKYACSYELYMNSNIAEGAGVYKKDGKSGNCTSRQTRLLLFRNLFLMALKLIQ
jgi:hypothetical protein